MASPGTSCVFEILDDPSFGSLLSFGLGAEPRVAGLEVRWPSGQVDTIGAVEANRTITIVEGQGLAR